MLFTRSRGDAIAVDTGYDAVLGRRSREVTTDSRVTKSRPSGRAVEAKSKGRQVTSKGQANTTRDALSSRLSGHIESGVTSNGLLALSTAAAAATTSASDGLPAAEQEATVTDQAQQLRYPTTLTGSGNGFSAANDGGEVTTEAGQNLGMALSNGSPRPAQAISGRRVTGAHAATGGQNNEKLRHISTNVGSQTNTDSGMTDGDTSGSAQITKSKAYDFDKRDCFLSFNITTLPGHYFSKKNTNTLHQDYSLQCKMCGKSILWSTSNLAKIKSHLLNMHRTMYQLGENWDVDSLSQCVKNSVDSIDSIPFFSEMDDMKHTDKLYLFIQLALLSSKDSIENYVAANPGCISFLKRNEIRPLVSTLDKNSSV